MPAVSLQCLVIVCVRMLSCRVADSVSCQCWHNRLHALLPQGTASRPQRPCVRLLQAGPTGLLLVDQALRLQIMYHIHRGAHDCLPDMPLMLLCLQARQQSAH